MTLFLHIFAFRVESTRGLRGLWLANAFSEILLISCYLYRMFERDWHDISYEAIKRIAQESKNAGCLQLT